MMTNWFGKAGSNNEPSTRAIGQMMMIWIPLPEPLVAGVQCACSPRDGALAGRHEFLKRRLSTARGLDDLIGDPLPNRMSFTLRSRFTGAFLAADH